MFRLAALSLMLLAAPVVDAQTAACSNIALGPMGDLKGFVPSPEDAWHVDVSGYPVDPKSDSMMVAGKTGLAGMHLHPDFGAHYGIPYVVVDTTTTPGIAVNWKSKWQEEGDTTLYPIPEKLPVEGNPKVCPTTYDDRHAIMLDRHQCVLYEMYQASYCNDKWNGINGAVWDMTEVEKRPYGFTSTDAAGLSVFEGLIRYEEIQAGQINHAIRFTAKFTKNNNAGGLFVPPATHAAGTNWGTDVIIGMRLRLKADFDISRFSPTNQIILKAMKKYGMILADNGSPLYFQGTPDARWRDDDLNALKMIGAESFEVLKMEPQYDAWHHPQGRKPAIKNFKASSTKIAPGAAVTLTAEIKDASYSVVDKGGFWRGPITVHPKETTTYTLVSSNEFGRVTASVTVEVAP